MASQAISLSAPSSAARRVENKWAFAALACPHTGQSLTRLDDSLVTPDGKHSYPIIREIPRFVSSDWYTRSFSFEWNVHNKTQIDGFREDNMSEKVLMEKTGLRPEQVRGKLVLDAGVGAGRFTEILTRWGANVVGVDLSFAVEASQEHFGHLPNALIAQADIGNLPFRPGTFDFIISIGVLHHTPDTKKYFSGLPKLLKPGGEIAIWVYPKEGDYITRNEWIRFVNKVPKKWFYSWCKVFVPWALKNQERRLVRRIAQVFPFSRQELGVENDILDTFDGYSPAFHGIHTVPEVRGWFEEAGLVNLRDYPQWTTAVRGTRPIK